MLLPTVMLATCLAGCGPYPDDVEGTLHRVETHHRIRLGMTDLPPQTEPATQAFLACLSKATGAAIDPPQKGSTEELFAALDADKLDLVIAEVAKDSPWLTEVAVIEPIAERPLGERKLGLSPVARNGENRWIMLLEREARDIRSCR